jgi:hypothetical protein
VYHGLYDVQRPDSFQKTGSIDYAEVAVSARSIVLSSPSAAAAAASSSSSSPLLGQVGAQLLAGGECVERNGDSFVLKDSM